MHAGPMTKICPTRYEPSLTWCGQDGMVFSQSLAAQTPEPGCKAPCTSLISLQGSLALPDGTSGLWPFPGSPSVISCLHTGLEHTALLGAHRYFLLGHSALKVQRQLCIPILNEFYSRSAAKKHKKPRKQQPHNAVDFSIY